MGVKRAKSHGTIFKVRLPYVADPTQEREALAREAAASKGYRILLVDDEKPVVRLFEQGLNLLGHKIVPAYSGRQGLQLFGENRYDAVVCGLAMAEVNGWDLAIAVRDYCLANDVPKPPVIVLTGYAGASDSDQLDTHPGVDRLLQKPVAVEKLAEVITEEVIRCSGDEAFSGRVDRVDLLEYFQLLLLSGKKIVIEITSRDGIKGLVFLNRGEVSHAECDGLAGEEALYRCLTFKGGSFTSHSWRDPGKNTIGKPGQMLLIEAARRRDEIRERGLQDRNRQQKKRS
jgi:CheY-like chemotaxis protein